MKEDKIIIDVISHILYQFINLVATAYLYRIHSL